MKYLKSVMLLILAWVVFIGLVTWLGVVAALSFFLGLTLILGLLIILFPKTFIWREEEPLPEVQRRISPQEIAGYLEKAHPGHRILFRKDTYSSNRNGRTTRTLLYSHSLTVQDWLSLVEFLNLDGQEWRLYSGRNGSYGLKKYTKG